MYLHLEGKGPRGVRWDMVEEAGGGNGRGERGRDSGKGQGALAFLGGPTCQAVDCVLGPRSLLGTLSRMAPLGWHSIGPGAGSLPHTLGGHPDPLPSPQTVPREAPAGLLVELKARPCTAGGEHTWEEGPFLSLLSWETPASGPPPELPVGPKQRQMVTHTPSRGGLLSSRNTQAVWAPGL